MRGLCTVIRMVGWLWLGLLIIGLVGLVVIFNFGRKKREAQALADAREEALRWYERLGGQVMNLGGEDPAVKQALVDAGERYNAAGGQLDRATSAKQYELARETALEGLAYARAARVALGLDPGPEIPPLAGQRAAGQITKEREVDVQGQRLKASPNPQGDTPYYYPGGNVAGRPVPGGWYSQPWWRTALTAGAWGIGSMLVFDALLSPAWGDSGYASGFQDGFASGEGHGSDSGGDGGGADSGADSGADGGYDAGGFDSGGGDWGGGDFGGGDFGGGSDFF